MPIYSSLDQIMALLKTRPNTMSLHKEGEILGPAAASASRAPAADYPQPIPSTSGPVTESCRVRESHRSPCFEVRRLEHRNCTNLHNGT